MQVFSIVNSMKEQIGERDINASIVFLTNNWEFWCDSPEQFNFRYGCAFVLGEPIEQPEEEAEKFNHLSAADLQRAATKLFASENMTSYVYCNKDKVKLRTIEKYLEKGRQVLSSQ